MAAPVLFITTWAVAGTRVEGYDPTEQFISELAAIGSPTRALLNIGLIGFGVGVLVFAAAFDRLAPGRSRLPLVAMALNAVGTIALVAAPCTAGCPGAGTTTTDSAHYVIAVASYVGLATVPLTVAWRLRGQAGWRAVARFCAVNGIVTSALLLVLALEVSGLATGGWQRLATTVGDLTYVVLGIACYRRERG